ncbi:MULTISPECIES: hypothetical protein [Pantoea]|uniref:Uncharacterized protein n=1 Tax=Pantoea brenneri TaxID=472694 RepID=A0ABU9MGF6_9GAMM|nr:hypothetical protein [Pantoea sp. 3.5.1]
MILEDMTVKWLEKHNGHIVEKAGFMKLGDFHFSGDGLNFTHKGDQVNHSGVAMYAVYREGDHELAG